MTMYTLKNIRRLACTMLLPAHHLERVDEISLRTGIPRNTITALALDEYLQRHYPSPVAPWSVEQQPSYGPFEDDQQVVEAAPALTPALLEGEKHSRQ